MQTAYNRTVDAGTATHTHTHRARSSTRRFCLSLPVGSETFRLSKMSCRPAHGTATNAQTNQPRTVNHRTSSDVLLTILFTIAVTQFRAKMVNATRQPFDVWIRILN